jgi:hypothetical protein
VPLLVIAAPPHGSAFVLRDHHAFVDHRADASFWQRNSSKKNAGAVLTDFVKLVKGGVKSQLMLNLIGSYAVGP